MDSKAHKLIHKVIHMRSTILSKSSSGDPYEVTFMGEDDRIRVFCRCAAGSTGSFCKHKVGLIMADLQMLHDQSHSAALCAIQEWTQFHLLKSRTERFLEDIKAIEKQKTALSSREKILKRDFSRDLAEGLR